jgi:hypothetical protein
MQERQLVLLVTAHRCGPWKRQPVMSSLLLWSPTVKSVDYMLTQNLAPKISEQPSGGGTLHRLMNVNGGQSFDFDWSTSGKRFLLCRADVGNESAPEPFPQNREWKLVMPSQKGIGIDKAAVEVARGAVHFNQSARFVVEFLVRCTKLKHLFMS